MKCKGIDKNFFLHWKVLKKRPWEEIDVLRETCMVSFRLICLSFSPFQNHTNLKDAKGKGLDHPLIEKRRGYHRLGSQ